MALTKLSRFQNNAEGLHYHKILIKKYVLDIVFYDSRVAMATRNVSCAPIATKHRRTDRLRSPFIIWLVHWRPPDTPNMSLTISCKLICFVTVRVAAIFLDAHVFHAQVGKFLFWIVSCRDRIGINFLCCVYCAPRWKQTIPHTCAYLRILFGCRNSAVKYKRTQIEIPFRVVMNFCAVSLEIDTIMTLVTWQWAQLAVY